MSPRQSRLESVLQPQPVDCVQDACRDRGSILSDQVDIKAYWKSQLSLFSNQSELHVELEAMEQ